MGNKFYSLSLSILVLASVSCSTTKDIDKKTYSIQKTEERKDKIKEREKLLYWINEIATGWIPGYSIIRYEFFDRDSPD
ncbi:MAG: hypothetical protein AABW80_04710 [Nanoarchaeota archaeon]